MRAPQVLDALKRPEVRAQVLHICDELDRVAIEAHAWAPLALLLAAPDGKAKRIRRPVRSRAGERKHP